MARSKPVFHLVCLMSLTLLLGCGSLAGISTVSKYKADDLLIEVQAENFWEINQAFYLRTSNAEGLVQDTAFIGSVYEARTGKIKFSEVGDAVSITVPNL